MKNVFKFAYVTVAVAAMAVCFSTPAFAAATTCAGACAAGKDSCLSTCSFSCSAAGVIAYNGVDVCYACKNACQAGSDACNAACPVPTKPA